MSWLHHADRSGCWLKYRLRASRPALHLGRRFTGCNTRRHRTRLHIVTRCYTLWHPNDVQTGNLGIWFEAWSCNILSWFSCFSEIRRCAIAPSDRCLQRKRPCDTSAGGSNSLVDTRGYQPCTICGQFRKDWIWIYCWHLFTVFHVSEICLAASEKACVQIVFGNVLTGVHQAHQSHPDMNTNHAMLIRIASMPQGPSREKNGWKWPLGAAGSSLGRRSQKSAKLWDSEIVPDCRIVKRSGEANLKNRCYRTCDRTRWTCCFSHSSFAGDGNAHILKKHAKHCKTSKQNANTGNFWRIRQPHWCVCKLWLAEQDFWPRVKDSFSISIPRFVQFAETFEFSTLPMCSSIFFSGPSRWPETWDVYRCSNPENDHTHSSKSIDPLHPDFPRTAQVVLSLLQAEQPNHFDLLKPFGGGSAHCVLKVPDLLLLGKIDSKIAECTILQLVMAQAQRAEGHAMNWSPTSHVLREVTCGSGTKDALMRPALAPQVQLWVLSLLLTKKAKPHLFVKHVACILVEFLLLLLKVENVEIISSVSHEALGSEGSATAHRARLDRQRATCCRSRAAVVAAVVTSCDAKLPRWAAGKTIPRCNSQNFKLNELKTLTHFFAKLWLKLCKWVNVVENQFGWVLPFWVVGQRATTEGWLKFLK